MRESESGVSETPLVPHRGSVSQAKTMSLPSVGWGERLREGMRSFLAELGLSAERLTVIGLLAVLLLGAYFRFLNQNWDNSQHLHPDERFLTMVGSAIQPPANLAEYFNTDASPLNPHNKGFGFFVYGTLPVFIVRYTAGWLDSACTTGWLKGLCAFDIYSDYDHIFLLGRSLSAIADLLSLVLVFFIGRRLYDRRIGLLAAFLYAIAVFPIQQAHFYTVDAMSTTFVVATMYFAVRIADEGRWWDYVLAGILMGMAVAARVNVAVLGGVIGLAAAMHALKFLPRLRTDAEFRELVVLRTANLFIVAMLLAVIVFRIGQPYAFTGPGFLGVQLNPKWLANMEEIAGQLSGERESPPGIQWAGRIMYFDPWKNIVLWGLGLPLGLAAWGAWLWAIIRSLASLRRVFAALHVNTQAQQEWRSHILTVIWIGGYFFVAARSWSHTMRYFLPIYPFLTLMAAWGLVKLWDITQQRAEDGRRMISAFRLSPSAPRLAALAMVGVLGGTFLWAVAFIQIYTRPVSREAASIWMYENIPSVASLLLQTPEGRAREYQMTMGTVVNLIPGSPHVAQFQLDGPATLTGVRFNYLMATNRDPTPRTIRVKLATDPGGTQVMDEAQITAVMNTGRDERGQAYSFQFPNAPTLAADTTYYLITEVLDGGPVMASTSVIAAETDWDDWLPLRLDGRDPYSMMYNGVNLQLYWEEDPPKRENMLQVLDQADYIAMSSQRVVWSVVRIPERWPMTIAYYEKLFSGELGFDLVGVFHSLPNLGPLIISDISAELAWGRPPVIGPYVSELGADEAFSVYDHPPVWIFRKNPERYNHEAVRAFLYSFDPAQVIKTPAREVGRRSTTQLMLDEQARQRNEAGGTWSEMFSWESLLVQFEPLAMAVWWLTVLILGGLAFPIAFIAMRGLADRGYVFSKILALLLLAYGAWVAGSLRLLPFTRSTLLLMVLILGAVATVIVRARREEIVAFVRAQRQHILFVEGLFFLFYLFFIFVRLGNPELWHPAFGGEKPMNFAYFNAILKTTWFPPYDPWFAGGYINYYYFGYVIAAVIPKLLGLVPAYAYNLILPMLFSLTALGGFGIAYNLVVGRQRAAVRDDGGRGREDERLPGNTVLARLFSLLRRTPYATGVMAALLLMVLGNLGEIHLIIEKGFMALAPADNAPCTFKSAIPGLQPLVCNTIPAVDRTLTGITKVLEGERLPIATNWWYWNATRVIPPAECEAGPITEFPYFTFLYADMHAHMFAMSLALLSFALGLSWIQDRRRSAPEPSAAALGTSWVVEDGSQEALPAGRVESGAEGAHPPAETLLAPEASAAEAGVAGIAAVASASPVVEEGVGEAQRADGLEVEAAVGLEPTVDLWAGLRQQGMRLWPLALSLGLLALGAGVMWPTNAWDYYTYLALAMAAVALGEIEHEGRLTLRAVARGVALAAVVAVLSYALFLPYRRALASGRVELEPWQGSKTPIWAYLILNGVFLFILVSWMLHEAIGWLRSLGRDDLERLRAWWGPVGAALLLGVALLLLVPETSFWSKVEQTYPVLITPLVLPLILLAGLLTLRPGIEAERRIISALVAVALALTFVVEVVVPKGLDIGRMNTVFKLYMQVWIMLAVTSGVALVWLWQSSRAWAPRLRQAWRLALGVLLFCAALYPIQATRAKWEDRFAPRDIPPTLNGMAYMQGAQYDEGTGPFSLRGDYDAIRWMQENIQGSPVIVEAASGYPGPNAPLYHYGNRVSINTGLPAVMGWDWHQKQQRSLVPGGTPGEWIDQREQQVHDFYTVYDAPQALEFLKRYRVRYVYVGPEERALYGTAGLAKFDQMAELRLVYQNPQVKIYAVMLPVE